MNIARIPARNRPPNPPVWYTVKDTSTSRTWEDAVLPGQDEMETLYTGAEMEKDARSARANFSQLCKLLCFFHAAFKGGCLFCAISSIFGYFWTILSIFWTYFVC